MGATLALTSYANDQKGIPNSTAGAAASATSSTSSSATATQSAIQGAQSTLMSSTLNLLG